MSSLGCILQHQLALRVMNIQLQWLLTFITLMLTLCINVSGVRAHSPASSTSSLAWLRNRGSTLEIDLELLRRQGIDAEAFMARLRGLAEGGQGSPCTSSPLETADMRLNTLTNRSVTCNDGTPAGYT